MLRENFPSMQTLRLKILQTYFKRKELYGAVSLDDIQQRFYSSIPNWILSDLQGLQQ